VQKISIMKEINQLLPTKTHQTTIARKNCHPADNFHVQKMAGRPPQIIPAPTEEKTIKNKP
jgi:hypothetical protein